jgi:hypothetical protein
MNWIGNLFLLYSIRCKKNGECVPYLQHDVKTELAKNGDAKEKQLIYVPSWKDNDFMWIMGPVDR